MTDAIFLTILAGLSSAVVKLWSDTKALTKQNAALAERHLTCETELAKLRERVSHLERVAK